MASQVLIKQPDTRIGTMTFNATGVVNQSPATADITAGPLAQTTGKLAGKGRASRKGDDLAESTHGAAGENAEHRPADGDAGESTAALRGNDAVMTAQADIRADATLSPQGGSLAAPAATASFSPWVLGGIGLGAATAVAVSSRDHGTASASTSTSTTTPSVASASTGATTSIATATTAATATATAISTATVKSADSTRYTAPVDANVSTQPEVDVPARPAAESTATVTDAGGTTSALVNVTAAGLTAPPVAQISGLYDAVGIRGQIINGTVTDDATPTLSGHATAGMTVTVRDNDAVIGTVLASSTGYWSFAPTTALTAGSHAFTVTVTDSTGLSSAASAPIRFTVDTAPAFVTLDEVLDNVGSTTGTLEYGESTDDAAPQLKGTATPGATVEVYDSHGIADALADKIGTAIADSTGHWTFTPTLNQGVHEIYAHVNGTAGIANSSAHQFIVTTSPVVITPMYVTLEGVFDDTGSVLLVGIIRSTGDASPQLKGTATPGATVELYDSHGIADASADKIGSAIADGTGHWTYTPTLEQGRHSVYAYVGTTAGSASSDVRDFIVTTLPAFVTLDEVLDNVGSTTGPVGYGEATDDAAPQLKGTATPGATVELYDSHGIADASADKIGTVIADGTGNWTYTPTLDQGLHGIYAYVGGIAGVASTNALEFFVDKSTLAAKNMTNSTVASFDKFDLSGNGDNTLKLSLDDVLNLGRTDLYLRDGNTQVMVNGDEGDAVELSSLDGNWSFNGTATVASETYAVYEHSTAAAEAFIQHGVTAVLM